MNTPVKKIIVIPDSFKGTLTSSEICALIGEQIHRFLPGCDVIAVPVADGGEGSVAAFLAAMGGTLISCPVSNPRGKTIHAHYGLIQNGQTAVIEMAACAGLPLMGDELDVLGATTYGVGQLMADALDHGVSKIILGLGGSATNDGGCGMAAALGIRFLDNHGTSFIPTGGTLARIHAIDDSELDPRWSSIKLIGMCDIDNPLFGPQGAAAVFAPQKGADSAMVRLLDQGLQHLAHLVPQVSWQHAGAGAAGGMGFGCLAFLHGQLKMGIETVLDTVEFDQMLSGAQLVITGEGRLDSQSLRGKVVVGVARRAHAAGIPVIALVGDIAADIEAVYEQGVSAVFSTNRMAIPFSEARVRAKADLSAAAADLCRLITCLLPSGDHA